jgi:hypothetical protein
MPAPPPSVRADEVAEQGAVRERVQHRAVGDRPSLPRSEIHIKEMFPHGIESRKFPPPPPFLLEEHSEPLRFLPTP